MNAGRELDALVAEKVMEILVGHKILSKFIDLSVVNPHGTEVPIKRYSTDIAAAWEVVEKMVGECGYAFKLELEYGIPVGAEAFFWEPTVGMHYRPFTAQGIPASAICLAALKAKGIEIDEE